MEYQFILLNTAKIRLWSTKSLRRTSPAEIAGDSLKSRETMKPFTILNNQTLLCVNFNYCQKLKVFQRKMFSKILGLIIDNEILNIRSL